MAYEFSRHDRFGYPKPAEELYDDDPPRGRQLFDAHRPKGLLFQPGHLGRRLSPSQGSYGSPIPDDDVSTTESEELIFDIELGEPSDEASTSYEPHTPLTETPPTPTGYGPFVRDAQYPSSYFGRPDPPPPLPPSEADDDAPNNDDDSFQGFNRGELVPERLADTLVNEVWDAFRVGGEDGANGWCAGRLKSLVDLLTNESVTSQARGEQEVQATEALLAYFHANLQISTDSLLPEIRRWRVLLYWSGLVESAEAGGDEW